MAINSISTKFSRIIGFLGGWYEKIWVKIVVDTLLYVPASIISIYATTDILNSAAGYILGEYVSTLDKYLVFLFLGSIILIYLLKEILPLWIGKVTSSENQLTLRGALTLMETLSSIVKVKSDRFGSTLERYQKTRQDIDSSEIFTSITLPEQQISYTIHALHTFLEKIIDGVEFDVRLVEISNNVPFVWYAYAPERNPPKTPIELLSGRESALSCCIKEKSLIVIPDIRKESKKTVKRRYLMLDEDECGSVICYPIYHRASKAYPFVLTIRANKANIFDPKRKDFYKWLLGEFSQRIQLEYNLIQLKDIGNV